MCTPKTFEEVIDRNLCRWPGVKFDQNEYCGNKRMPGKSYCAEHQRASYRKAQKNRKELTE